MLSSVSTRRPLHPTHRAAIREIFLRRRIEYTTQEAASLLRLSILTLADAIHGGALHVENRRKRKRLGGRRYPLMTWQELASAAMLRWTPMQIHDALREHANSILPSLFRPVELKGVRLPAYQLRLLEVLAQRENVSVEEYLYTALLGLETAISSEESEQLIPGLHDALTFPS